MAHGSRAHGQSDERNLGKYHVLGNADIPEIDVMLLDKRNHAANTLL